MSILASLVGAYDRLEPQNEVPPVGYARTEVEFCIVLKSDGRPAFDPVNFRSGEGKRNVGRSLDVPTPLAQRTSGISANFLWDKTAYSLGVTAGSGRRTAEEHQAFVDLHRKNLIDVDDVGAAALLHFLQWWNPQRFEELKWSTELKDANIVFALDTEYKTHFLHNRPNLASRWLEMYAAESASIAACLVTGKPRSRVARSHPPIKGVWNAQSSGASIVAFNQEAFASYGHEQGDNAPISETAAFKYTTALNAFLGSKDKNRLQIADASTVFWADASDVVVATEAENIFNRFFNQIDETMEGDKVGDKLALIVKGVPLHEIEPKLTQGVRFHVLGLSPNAARLSIRFWFEDDFGILTKNYQYYVLDMRFEPFPKHRQITTIRSLVLRTAPARRDRSGKIKFDTDRISPLLSGELFAAILTNERFPGALLSTLVMRIRTDHLIDSLRISLIKAIIVRTMRLEGRLPQNTHGSPQEDYLVRSDPHDPNPARRLGRLFALLERAQSNALGDEINATIKDKFLGAAAATPQQVFVGLIKLSQHHLKRLRNGHSDAKWIQDKKSDSSEVARRVGASLDRDIGRLWGSFNEGVPLQHSIEEQGLFLVGYYQERFGGKTDTNDGNAVEEFVSVDVDEE